MFATCLLATGCTDSERECASEDQRRQEQLFDEIDRRPVWIGSVIAFEDARYDPITFDFGGRYEVDVDVARIKPRDCDPATSLANGNEYTALMRAKMPVGSRFALVRSQDRDGQMDDEGFFRYLRSDGTIDTTRSTVNEELVEAGVAEPDPEIQLRSTGVYEPEAVVVSVENQRDQLSILDFAYWTEFVAAYQRADQRRVGPTGACAEQEIQKRRQYLDESQKTAERLRRWELGPDGRRGTADDFTDRDGDGQADVGEGSTSSGFDIPDSICPTRFC